MSKLKEIMESRNIIKKDFAKQCDIEVPMLSKFINDRCLPIRKDRLAISRELEVPQDKIWDREEFSLGRIVHHTAKDTYKFTAVIDGKYREIVTKMMNKLGCDTCAEFLTKLIDTQLENMDNEPYVQEFNKIYGGKN